MRPAAPETTLKAECWRHARDFARDIGVEWKAWLTGSTPMAGIALMSSINPEWIKLPSWSWSILIFVAGLIAAMFRVYRDLRRQHDSLRDRMVGLGTVGPFLLVPFEEEGKRTK